MPEDFDMFFLSTKASVSRKEMISVLNDPSVSPFHYWDKTSGVQSAVLFKGFSVCPIFVKNSFK